MTKPLAEQTPAEIDAQLYELYGQEWAAKTAVNSAWDHIHHAADDKKAYRYGKHAEWKMTNTEALAAVEALIADEATMAWTRKSAKDAQERLALSLIKVRANAAEQAPLNEEYIRRGRWTRAFLVTNGNGHVHSSMDCSTCNRGFYATNFQWMTEYSDHDEAEIVAAAGWRACTICYPSAPVSRFKTDKAAQAALPTAMFSDEDKRKAEAKAEREAAKVARDAKRIANAATKSGEPLEIRLNPYEGTHRGQPWTYYRLSQEFKTERAAITWATDQYYYSGPDAFEQEAIRIIAENVAEKHGKPVETVLAEIETKGRKKAGK